MKFISTEFAGLYEIQPLKKGDERGWFMRTFDIHSFSESIPNFQSRWVQMNHSFNAQIHTWRGFHFQKEPYQETKLIRCTAGKILDCVLDLRSDSSTYLKVYQVELSAENNKMLLIPKGCAHGFLTLAENSELVYLHDEFYSPDYESGVRHNDMKINFSLPVKPAIISERDLNHIDL